MPPCSNHYNSSVLLEATESMYGKLIAIVLYWLRYVDDGKPVILSFGLGADVAVKSIIGIPTLRQWGGSLDSISGKLSSRLLRTRNSPSTMNQPNKTSLIMSKSRSSDFLRPIISNPTSVRVLRSNIYSASTVILKDDITPPAKDISPVICDTNIGDYSKREVSQVKYK